MTNYAESADILAGGQWVNDRGIQRWVPTPGNIEPELAGVEACSKCHALTTEPCTSRTGRPIGAYHRARTGPQTCRCGAEREKACWFCDACRVENRRASWRQSMHRQRRAAAQTGAAA